MGDKKRRKNNLSSLFLKLKDKVNNIFLEDVQDLKLILELKRCLLLHTGGVKLFPDKFNVRVYDKALLHSSVTNDNACKYFCLSKYLFELLKFWEKKEFEYHGIDNVLPPKNSISNPNPEWSL